MTRETLIERVLAKTRVLVTTWGMFFEKVLPKIKRAVIGSGTITDISKQPFIKYVDESHYPYSEAEIGSEYVKEIIKLSGRQRASFTSAENKLLELPSPQYFAKRLAGTLAYVDIVAAFYSIYAKLGTYDAMIVGKNKPMFGAGFIPFIDLTVIAETKLARNAVVGVARKKAWQECRNGEFQTFQGTSNITSPQLWKCVALVLGGIAHQMIDNLGAHAVNMDGYIVDATKAQDAVSLVESWGLKAKIESTGKGSVFGCGSYRIGKKRTEREHGSQPVSNLPEMSRTFIERLRSVIGKM